MSADYEIRAARYARGKLLIACKSDGSGLKTRAMRLATAKGVRGRWTNREKGYIVSLTAAARFVKLYADGYDACTMTFTLFPPKKDSSR